MSDDISEVKSRLDIVDVVGQYVTGMKKAGRNYTARCPFHNERTPSFAVNPDLQIFKCFGCGEAGDAIAFIQKIERVDFGEALQMAAERVGYELTGKGRDKKQTEVIETLAKLNELAANYWNFILTKHNAGAAGREYSQKRKIRDEEIKKFSVGYAPAGDNLVQFLRKKGFTNEQIILAGLGVERNGQLVDKFRQRLILSIHNLKGQVVGFSGRIIVQNDKAPKYLNSPETPLYHKSEVLMGLYQAKEAARQQKFVIMQEGNIDLLSSHKAGVENIVATGGTAVTLQQMKMLKRLADTVYFCFDTDEAGRKALVKALEMAEAAALQHFVIDLGDFKDPDEMISADPRLWEAAVKNPVDSVEYLLNKFSNQVDLATAKGKRFVLEQMLPIVQAVRNPVTQEHYLKQTALKLETSTESVQKALDSLNMPTKRTYAQANVDQPNSNRQEATQVQQVQMPEIDKKEKYFLALLCANQHLDQLGISTEVFTDEIAKEILAAIEGSAEINFGQVSDTLSPQAQLLLQELLTMPLPEEIVAEIEKTYKLLYTRMLRRKLLAARAELNNGTDNTELLQQVQEITHELAILEK